ncbi:MAG: hypothetical protein LC118_04415 [Dehalococcoidia bacterium]|nr:hypothetical protein [Dehalococcoidia bacterium]
MPALRTLILAIIGLFLVWMIVAGVASYFGGHFVPDGAVPDSWAPPSSWATWRDILIVFTAIFFVIGGVLFAALMGALLMLALLVRRVLKENAVPALDSLKDSLDNVRGTTEFAGETVASPLIRTYAVVKGVRSGLGAVTGIGDRIRKRRGKK